MVTLIEYRASQPSNVQGKGVLPGGVTIPAVISHMMSGTQVADLGMFLSTDGTNRVELTGTVGVEAITGTSRLAFIILRDGLQIYATEQGVEDGGFERFSTTTLEAVDFNVPAGFHHYQLFVVNLTAGQTAEVVGPVTFSGAAYSLT